MNWIYKIQTAFSSKSIGLFSIILLFVFSPASYCLNSNQDTLAVIDHKVISSSDFISSYKEKLTRIGLTDNGETRLGYLMSLVTDELLIAESKNKGYDKTETAKKEYKRICLQELLNAYTIKYISPTININENELRNMINNIMIRPTTVPSLLEDVVLVKAIEKEALRLAVEHNKSIASTL